MRLVIALLLGLALAPAMAGCDRQNVPTPQGKGPEAGADRPGDRAPMTGASYPTGRLDRSHQGEAAPAVHFQDRFGRPASLADFRGRPLLVNLWATWCGPCVVEMPSLDALAGRQDRVRVVAISQDMDGRQKVSDFFARHRFTRLEPNLDPELGIMGALGIDTLPTTILYDAQGREVWRVTGMADWTSERAARLLREAGA